MKMRKERGEEKNKRLERIEEKREGKRGMKE